MSGDNNTSISPLSYGFSPSAFGDYSSYMPSMMGLTGVGSFGGGMNSVFDPLTSFGSLMYGGGMMGGMMDYWLDYQKNMQKLQNDLELSKLDHNKQMHAGMINSEVQAHEETMSGIIQKILVDGAVDSQVRLLYSKIKEGDQNGVCQEYDKLKDYVCATYEKELKAKGLATRSGDIYSIIDKTYSEIVSAIANDGAVNHTIEGDIEKYCDDAFQAGFASGFKGNNGQRFKAETIHHVTGKRINNRAYQDNLHREGRVVGMVCSGLKDIGVGGVEGAGLYALGVSTLALLAALCGVKCGNKGLGQAYKTAMKGTRWAAVLGIGVTGARDIINRTNNKNAA